MPTKEVKKAGIAGYSYQDAVLKIPFWNNRSIIFPEMDVPGAIKVKL
jgi:hypothetical protein